MQVKGIKRLYFAGISLCLIGTLALVAACYQLDSLIIKPWLDSQQERWIDGNLWTGYIVTPGYWIARVIFWLLYCYTSFKVAFLLMMFWTDFLIEKVIKHFRPVDSTFCWKKFLRLILIGLRITIVNLTIGLFFFILSFIPVVGIAIAFIGVAIISGRDILSPYILIIGDQDEALAKQYKYSTKSVFNGGLVQASITLIPFIGWVFLPFTHLLQIIGYAYLCEEKWQEKNAKQLSD